MAFVALVSGLFAPWLNSSYLGVGRVSADVVDLPGGKVYAAVVAVFVIGAAGGGIPRRGRRRVRRGCPPLRPRQRAWSAWCRRSRVALLIMTAGLAAYTTFWLGGELVLHLGSGFSFAHPGFGPGLVLGWAGSLLSVLVVGSSAQRGSTRPDEGDDLILLEETGGRSSEFASYEAFLDRLRVLSGGGDSQKTVPLVFVRLDGLNEVRRRYGSPAADRILMRLAHRLRANVRRDDTVVRFLPTEVFILLSGEVSEEHVKVVVRRLTTALAMPIPAVRRRHAKLVEVTVALARGRLTNGRLQVLLDDEECIDAPVAVVRSMIRRQVGAGLVRRGDEHQVAMP